MATKKKPAESGFVKIGDYPRIDHKGASPWDTRGQRIHWAYALDRQWARYPVRVTAPDKMHLFNFDVTLAEMGPMLILDNYGDEVLPNRLRRPVLTMGKKPETIGISYETGEIFRVAFIRERHESTGCPEEGSPGDTWYEFSMCFWAFPSPMIIPKTYRGRIPELKSKKRPFYLSLTEHSVYSFLTRWSSYADLGESLVVDLDFNERRLQVWGKDYREVSGWKEG